MYPSMIPRGLSFTKVIGGISKTLRVANQIIPIYQKAVPIISNARKAFSILKEFNKTDTKKVEQNNNISTNNSDINELQTKKGVTSSPTFFL